jgi:hypothetical protein
MPVAIRICQIFRLIGTRKRYDSTHPDQFRHPPRVLPDGGTVCEIVKIPWNIRRKFVKKSVGSSNVPANFVK